VTANILVKGIGAGAGNDSEIKINANCRNKTYKILGSDEDYKSAKKGSIAHSLMRGVCSH
jgi:hypothetical protein